MKNFLKFKTGDVQHDMRKFGEEYYLREARLWRPFRWGGVLSTVLALVLQVVAILDTHWVTITYSNSLLVESSLWEKTCPLLGNNTTSITCLTHIPHWQNAVIGLMIFSAVFGFVAAVLAICGVVTSPLPRKIYYFHSSGEIFFVCALSTTVALVMYPIALAIDEAVTSHSYGSGYGLGWGGSAFFFAASFCMSLDDLVRESAQNKCCRYLCWRSRTTGGDGTQNV